MNYAPIPVELPRVQNREIWIHCDFIVGARAEDPMHCTIETAHGIVRLEISAIPKLIEMLKEAA